MTPLYDDVIAINDFKLIKKIINKGEIKKIPFMIFFQRNLRKEKKIK
jgi:hypothetical protein